MKFFVTLISFFITGFSFAQNLTGVWQGNFWQGVGFYKQQYKYEVQINQLKNKALQGVTYSYRTTVFYGKANLQGIYMNKTDNIILKEDSLVEVKVAGNVSPCLMTCYLEYSKLGKTEILQGTYTSVNTSNNSDCGAGNVYLEKTDESDFEKEDFLTKAPKKITTPATPPPAKKDAVSKPKTQTPSSSSTAKRQPTAKPKRSTGKPLQKNIKPHKDSIVAKADTAYNYIEDYQPATPIIAAPVPKLVPKNVPVPKLLKDRENKLVRVVETTSPVIKIELYDNGEIDDDTVTVYHNNEVVAYKQRLSQIPITINITASESDPYHEFIMYADNLGRIPPNTALMVLTTGGKRYELFLTSTEQKNAKVVVQFKVPGKETK